MADSVVMVYPTIMDGPVVRWYRDEGAARYGREMASASRNGVGLNFAPREVANAAYDAFELMRNDRNADVSHLATHKRGVGDELVPVACCDMHTTTCEPPSELCCDRCAEARHPEHPPGVRCVLDVDPAPKRSFRITMADGFGGAPR